MKTDTLIIPDKVQSIFTPLEEAIVEINKRREDANLVKEVEAYLHNDIPEHFKNIKPILYLARHVASPSLETLHFIELAKQFDLPIVIGEDVKDKFVANNSLKRPLGKMPVIKGTARSGDEITEYFTVIDFATAQGKRLCDIKTKSGSNLIDLHHNLFEVIYPTGIQIVDESGWIDRNDRGDLTEHYKKMFSLLVVHGIMFEWYPPSESSLLNECIYPAYSFVLNKFGLKPLIYELVPEEIVNEKSWDCYPSVIYPFLKKIL